METNVALRQLREQRNFWLEQLRYAEQMGDAAGMASAQRMVNHLEQRIVRTETRQG